jgi:hypothetical protein
MIYPLHMGYNRNVEIVKYFTKTHSIMRTEQEYPSHHSLNNNSASSDALLNAPVFFSPEDENMEPTIPPRENLVDGLEHVHEFYPFEDEEIAEMKAQAIMDPETARHQELMIAEADSVLNIAVEIEEAMGRDIAGPSYQRAMNLYLGVVGLYGSPNDYTFYLKLGGTQARVATLADLKHYSTVMTEEKHKKLSPVDAAKVTHRPSGDRGYDRREDLFNSARHCYQSALTCAGGLDASREALATIFAERSAMKAIEYEYRDLLGQNRKAQEDLVEAWNNIENARIVAEYDDGSRIDPELVHRIEDQDTEVREVLMNGKNTSDLDHITVESLRDLVTA